MNIINKKPNLLEKSLLLACILGGVSAPVFNVSADDTIIYPSTIMPNFTELNTEQQTLGFLRFEVEYMIKAMPLTTERLKQVAQYFNANDDDKARAALDSAAITQEQTTLLSQLPQQPQLQAKLDDLATELILLASLTEIDTTLGKQRIAKASEYFEQALKSGRTPERLYEYARFLQRNNKSEQAEPFLVEAVALLRKQATSDPNLLPNLIPLLDELGSIKQAKPSQAAEAYSLYVDALSINRRFLAKHPESVSSFPVLFSSLSELVQVDASYTSKVEALYKEVINDLRPLVNSAPEVLPTLAELLNSQSVMITQNNTTHRQTEIEQLDNEALEIYRKLATTKPDDYLSYVSMMLSNLGFLISSDKTRKEEAEKLLLEALSISRQLSNTHPDAYIRNVFQYVDVIRLLEGLGRTHMKWNEPQKARAYLQEASDLIQPLVKNQPDYYKEQAKNIQEALAQLN